MKKLFAFSFTSLALALSFCTSSKQTTSGTEVTQTPTVTYLADIQPIVTNNCGPCHFPPKGSKKPLDNYADVRSEIDDIIARIQLNPGERGFMPAKHPKLPDTTIQAFKTWKEEGTPEK
jgi:hypothetical protein